MCVIVRTLLLAGFLVVVSANKNTATGSAPSSVDQSQSIESNQYYQLYMTLSDPSWPVNGTCGATVLNNYWAITAAMCCTEKDVNDIHVAYSPNHLRLRAGSKHLNTGGKWHRVVKVVAHPQFTGLYEGYDVCLLKVVEAFDVGGTVRALKLPTLDYSNGTAATITGWGLTMGNGTPSNTLFTQQTALVANSTECYALYKSGLMKFGEEWAEAYAKFINNRNLCTFKSDITCLGDAGSAVAVDDVLVGVVSWSIGCDNKIGVHARVSAFSSWIQDVMIRE